MSFYRDKLGFKLQNKEDDFAYLVFRNQAGPGLALISIESAAKLISDTQVRPKEETIHRNYVAVFLEDVDKEYEELKARGGSFREASHDFSLESANSLL